MEESRERKGMELATCEEWLENKHSYPVVERERERAMQREWVQWAAARLGGWTLLSWHCGSVPQILGGKWELFGAAKTLEGNTEVRGSKP